MSGTKRLTFFGAAGSREVDDVTPRLVPAM